MLRSLTSLAKALPFCCGLMFIAAAEDDCTIRILTEEDDDDGCEDTESVCNLDCELAVNDEGCSICECAEQPPTGCESDADCGAGQVCEFIEACPPCVSEGCDVACSFDGVCVEVNTDPCALIDCSPDTFCAVDESGQALCIPRSDELCTFDEECGDGRFCDFTQCGGSDGANRPAPPDDDGDNDVVCAGVCSEREPIGCEAVLCSEGTHCVEDFGGPVCVPNESECNRDEECGPGGRCEITCQSDPGCPDCDVCLVVGQCVDNGDVCAQICGPGSECSIDADGNVTCEERPEPECTSDADCASGSCNAGDVCMSDPACGPNSNGLVACDAVCWGYCVEPQPASCFEDAECAAGEVCVLVDNCGGCPDGSSDCFAPCTVEGRCTAP